MNYSSSAESGKLKSFTQKSKQIGANAANTIADSSKKVGSSISQVFKDFKAFLDRGNVVDVAVALVMGAAFTGGKKL